MDQTRTEKYSGTKGGRGRPRQPYLKVKYSKEYKTGTWIRERTASLPENTIGTCKNAEWKGKRGRGRPLCDAVNVELGNGYCVSCWDKRSGRKVIV
jgi:hypothetical protein